MPEAFGRHQNPKLNEFCAICKHCKMPSVVSYSVYLLSRVDQTTKCGLNRVKSNDGENMQNFRFFLNTSCPSTEIIPGVASVNCRWIN